MNKDLKSTYKNSLILFTIFNVAIFWIFIATNADLSGLVDLYKKLSVKDSLLFIFAPILSLVLSGLLSADAKASLVYQKIRNPLPGSEAFTKYMLEDTRIDYQSIQENHSPLPTEPHEQNRLWYKLYKTVASEPVVANSHRQWLFARDLSAFAVIFLVVFGNFAVVSSAIWLKTSVYIAYLVVQLILLVIPARNYGKRFVTNVLSTVSTNAGE